MKAFASDLDGTLVFDRKVKDMDKEAIHMLSLIHISEPTRP